jgi:mRNA degradation ribonuclease J1/J2
VDGERTDFNHLARLGDEGVLLLLSDSTNAERTGWTPSESTVSDAYYMLFANAQGRILVTTFASNLHRLQQAIDMAQGLWAQGRRAGQAHGTECRHCRAARLPARGARRAD